jgi:bacteriocin-like protein
MKTIKIIENGRSFKTLSSKEMSVVNGGNAEEGICICDARFEMSGGTIRIGWCICDRRY